MGFRKGRGCGRCKGEARRDREDGTIKSVSLVQTALDNAGRDRRTGLTVKRGTGEQVVGTWMTWPREGIQRRLNAWAGESELGAAGSRRVHGASP